MAADRSYVAKNDAERRRLETLVARLDDATLGRPLPAGWTIAAVLAHLAFWDQRIVVLVERLRRDEPVLPLDDDVDWINDAAKPLLLALPPRRAAETALEVAAAADRAVAALSDAELARNAAAGNRLNVQRFEHRREHLDEIESALGR